jgi:hypothetical protein
MKSIRASLTYANVMATLAVFLVLGGGAYAAVQLPKNSVGAKQLKKNAVTADKIKAGAVTGAKVKVATLAKVPQAQSADHASSADRATSADDASKLGGVTATRYLTVGSKLGSGETEVGVFATSAPDGSYGSVAINFFPRLPGRVPGSNAEILSVGATTAGCPGPRRAAAGFLCVYEVQNNEMFSPAFGYAFSSEVSEVAEPEGTVITFSSSDAGGNVRGNWAYTAP